MDSTSLPVGEYGFPGPLRDKLVAAILDGSKTTTSSLVCEYDGALPQPGDREVVVDSDKQPVCITEVTDVAVTPFIDVPLPHALNEGEGFSTVDQWRDAHLEFWHSEAFRHSIGDLSFQVTDDTLVVRVQFRVTNVF